MSNEQHPSTLWLLSTLALALLAGACGTAWAALQGPPREPQAVDPADRKREHVRNITRAEDRYAIRFRGTVDGVMTRSPIGYAAYSQGFQPNVRVRLENVGDTDVVNPWLTVNGKRNWRTVQDIVAEATRGHATERDRALAIWRYQMAHRFHACTWDGEVNDPVKALNVYGYTLCGNDAYVLADLMRTAGLKTRRGFPIGHCTTEVFFDGAYHLLDGDEGIICLLRDNETIADEAQIVRDHDLMKRTHTYNLLAGDSRQTDEFSASLHWYEGKREGEHRSHIGHTMDFTLRPSEWIEWRWDHIGKQYTNGTAIEPGTWKSDGEGDLLGGWGKQAYDKLRNGRLGYAPDLRRPAARRGVETQENLAWEESAGVPALHPAAAGKDAVAVWRVASPYVVVGGKVTLAYTRGAGDSLRLALSTDGKAWTDVWTAAGTGAAEESVVLDAHLSPRGRPHYRYFVRLTMSAAGEPASVGINALSLDTDVQMSALALPELEVGENRIAYRDETKGPRRVRVTHEWIERTSMRPPAAPPAPLHPAAGATVDGTRFAFTWQPPAGEEKVTDYHFQLSAHPDMRWPLSPNFDRLVSRTPDRGKARWSIPYLGLLNPDRPYYWRVRAQSDQGVWGPWSRTWSFRCRAPGVPLSVTAHADPASGTVRLTWDANPAGTPPARFKVYASDEKGFTASDSEYTRFMGRGFCTTLEEFKAKSGKEPGSGSVKTPSNLLGEAEGRELLVVGPGLNHPNANRAYYRVVAVDADGRESGPSDYAEVPRPFFHTLPAAEARAGQVYCYQAGSIASIGHLTCKGGYNAAFWDRERLSFSLEKAPAWLKVDAATGEVSGTPDAAGEHEVVLAVENGRGGKAEQRFRIRVAP